jgi:hypothetical protein
MHYQRWRVYGVLTSPDDPAARFVRHLAPPDGNGCRLWTRGRDPAGYGKFRAEGRSFRAHRWAYEHFIDPIPAGFLVCHHCDNPPCCEPSHLFLGTQQANMSDKMAKGRHRYVTHPKLSDDDVRQIRALASSGVTQIALASTYRISQSMVSMIVAGKRR